MSDRDRKDGKGQQAGRNVLFIEDKKSFTAAHAKALAKASFFVASGIRSNGLRSDLEEAARNVLESALDVLFFSDAVQEGLVRDTLMFQSVLDLAVVRGALSQETAAVLAAEYEALSESVLRIVGPQPFTIEDLLEGPMLSSGRPEVPRRLLERTPSPREPRVPARPREHATPTARGDEILSILKSLGKASIKDIAIRIRGVSEKTVQRELSRLVAARKVKKEGERRWSTYSLL